MPGRGAGTDAMRGASRPARGVAGLGAGSRPAVPPASARTGAGNGAAQGLTTASGGTGRAPSLRSPPSVARHRGASCPGGLDFSPAAGRLPAPRGISLVPAPSRPHCHPGSEGQATPCPPGTPPERRARPPGGLPRPSLRPAGSGPDLAANRRAGRRHRPAPQVRLLFAPCARPRSPGRDALSWRACSTRPGEALRPLRGWQCAHAAAEGRAPARPSHRLARFWPGLTADRGVAPRRRPAPRGRLLVW